MLTQPNILAAYLYLLQGEPMPEPVLLENGEIDIAADDAALEAWSKGRDTFTVDQLYLQRFIIQTETLLVELEELKLNSDEPAPSQYMALFYNAAKEVFDHDKTRLRTYFEWLYLVIFQRPEGSRWGEFVDVYGVNNFVAMVRARFANLI